MTPYLLLNIWVVFWGSAMAWESFRRRCLSNQSTSRSYVVKALRCTSWFGHKYEGRYDEVPMPSTPERVEMVKANFDEIEDVYRVYVHDVCVRCGDVIERSFT